MEPPAEQPKNGVSELRGAMPHVDEGAENPPWRPPPRRESMPQSVGMPQDVGALQDGGMPGMLQDVGMLGMLQGGGMPGMLVEACMLGMLPGMLLEACMLGMLLGACMPGMLLVACMLPDADIPGMLQDACMPAMLLGPCMPGMLPDADMPSMLLGADMPDMLLGADMPGMLPDACTPGLLLGAGMLHDMLQPVGKPQCAGMLQGACVLQDSGRLQGSVQLDGMLQPTGIGMLHGIGVLHMLGMLQGADMLQDAGMLHGIGMLNDIGVGGGALHDGMLHPQGGTGIPQGMLGAEGSAAPHMGAPRRPSCGAQGPAHASALGASGFMAKPLPGMGMARTTAGPVGRGTAGGGSSEKGFVQASSATPTTGIAKGSAMGGAGAASKTCATPNMGAAAHALPSLAEPKGKRSSQLVASAKTGSSAGLVSGVSGIDASRRTSSPSLSPIGEEGSGVLAEGAVAPACGSVVGADESLSLEPLPSRLVRPHASHDTPGRPKVSSKTAGDSRGPSGATSGGRGR